MMDDKLLAARRSLKTDMIHIQLSDEKEHTLNVSRYIEVPTQDENGEEAHWVRHYVEEQLAYFCDKMKKEVNEIMLDIASDVMYIMEEE